MGGTHITPLSPHQLPRTHGDDYAMMTRAHSLDGAERGESTNYVFYERGELQSPVYFLIDPYGLDIL